MLLQLSIFDSRFDKKSWLISRSFLRKSEMIVEAVRSMDGLTIAFARARAARRRTAKRRTSPAHAIMKKIHLLLGSSDRRISNLIEIAVRDACYGQGVVECYRSSQLDDFTQRGCIEEHDLIIFTPGHLLPGLVRKKPRDVVEEAVSTIQSIKEHRQAPLIAIGVSQDNELRLLMAGAENVFPILFNEDALKGEVRRVLGMAEPSTAEETSTPRRSTSSWAEIFAKGLERLGIGVKAGDLK
jgi:hypothetical protein